MFGAAVALALCLLSPTLAGAEDDPPQSVENSLGMKFAFIPAGEFEMGAEPGDTLADADESPRRRVTITRGYWLGVHEVTQAQFAKVMGENPSWFSPTGGGREALAEIEAADLPVDFVSWRDAQSFCHGLSERPAETDAGRHYRLPTEAEWERAAQGDERSNDVSAANIAPTPGESGEVRRPITKPVGSFPPNAFGLYDLRGNVWEWCSDRYRADAYRDGNLIDPEGPTEGTGRVIRGGDFRSPARFARPSNRDFTRETRRDLGNGFRVVLVERKRSQREADSKVAAPKN